MATVKRCFSLLQKIFSILLVQENFTKLHWVKSNIAWKIPDAAKRSTKLQRAPLRTAHDFAILISEIRVSFFHYHVACSHFRWRKYLLSCNTLISSPSNLLLCSQYKSMFKDVFTSKLRVCYAKYCWKCSVIFLQFKYARSTCIYTWMELLSCYVYTLCGEINSNKENK